MIRPLSMNVGLEVECVVSNPTCSIGNYHEGESIGKYWDVEVDASLSHQRKFVNSDTDTLVEFVSCPFGSERLPVILADLRDVLREFTDVQYFSVNSSCGAHIHFSFENVKVTKDQDMLMRMLEAVGAFDACERKVFEKLKQKLSQEAYAAFAKQYYRKYANEPIDALDYNRYQTWNMRGVDEKGGEWRGFNLEGIEKIFGATYDTKRIDKFWESVTQNYQAAIESMQEAFFPALENPDLKLSARELRHLERVNREAREYDIFRFLEHYQKYEFAEHECKLLHERTKNINVPLFPYQDIPTLYEHQYEHQVQEVIVRLPPEGLYD